MNMEDKYKYRSVVEEIGALIWMNQGESISPELLVEILNARQLDVDDLAQAYMERDIDE